MTKAVEKIKLRQTGSSIRRNKKQALYLKSLGLGKIGSEKELVLNNSIKSLIEKVRHMVEVIS
ncbi:MAG: 50S ribosomal protein L30 [Alphaproteobacteria bacterium]|nr:50S ribosomal protein L30 [Alphaproteobacteria bacterium]